jgi:hypothetical protein
MNVPTSSLFTPTAIVYGVAYYPVGGPITSDHWGSERHPNGTCAIRGSGSNLTAYPVSSFHLTAFGLTPPL